MSILLWRIEVGSADRPKLMSHGRSFYLSMYLVVGERRLGELVKNGGRMLGNGIQSKRLRELHFRY